MNSDSFIENYDLSPMQQGMLFHSLKEPTGGVDIEQIVLHLPESIDPSRMDSAWQWLTQRHGILRTRFEWKGVTEPHQTVVPSAHLPFQYEDALGLSAQTRDARLRHYLDEDRALGFNLGAAPMARVQLFRWKEASFTLIWTIHHALLDGRSFPLLLKEVFEAYEELAVGTIRDRPAPTSFGNHIEFLRSQNTVDSDGFWTEVLKGYTTPLELPIRRAAPLPAEAGSAQGELWEHLDEPSTLRLKDLAAREGLTLNALLQGAWAVLLHRYTGETDIVFGATRACRKSSFSGAENSVGLFINTVPVRLHLDSSEPVLAVCHRARALWVAMRPHENASLARLKTFSQVPPSQPLFQSLLVFENERLDRSLQSLGGAWVQRGVELHELTNFPIALAAYGGSSLSLKAEFARSTIDPESIRRLLGHLHRILVSMVTNPEVTVGRVEWLSSQEFQTLTTGVQSPSPDAAKTKLPLDGESTLHALFEASARHNPESIALHFEGHSLTYRELNAKANRVARHLLALGIKPNTLVGLFLERTPELVIALLGIIKSGGAYLPIDLAYPAERMAYMLEDSQAPVLLTQRSLADKLPASRATVVFIEDILKDNAPNGTDENPAVSNSPEDLAYVIYTSGTTGKPKGTTITHRNVVRLFSQTEHWFSFGPSDVWTLFHSIAFDFSVWELWGALLYGGKLILVPYLHSRSPRTFYQLLAEQGVTVLNQTPSAFRQLMQAEALESPRTLSLRYVIFGGEALELRSLEPWFQHHGDQRPQLVNMYGITETTVHVTYRPVSQRDLDAGSVIGVPIPDLQLFVLDSNRQPVPIGVPGEIYVAGAGLAPGYLRRPDLTLDRFVPHPFSQDPTARLYRTGDLARLLPGGDVEYLGRIDHQVKIRGFRIELGEIESSMCLQPAIAESMALVRDEGAGEKRLVAYWVPKHGASIPTDLELRQHLRRLLPEYMIPSAFVRLEGFPLTPHGKVDRKALPAPKESSDAANSAAAPPRGATEETIARVCREILRRESLGVEDNFFDLGAHSILLVRIHQRLMEVLGREFPLVDLFQHSTVRNLAQHLDKQPGVSEAGAEPIAERARKQREAANRLRQQRPKR